MPDNVTAVRDIGHVPCQHGSFRNRTVLYGQLRISGGARLQDERKRLEQRAREQAEKLRKEYEQLKQQQGKGKGRGRL